MAFSMAFAFTLFSLPLSLVGMIMSKNCANAGSTSAMCRVGKILGLVGVITTGVMFLFGLIGLGM